MKSLFNLVVIDTSGFFIDFYPIRGSSFVVEYGTVYIASEDGLYALKETSPPEVLAQDEPSFQKSPQKSLSYKISPPNISYTLKTRGRVKIEVYDVFGRLVNHLLNTYQDAGHYSLRWDRKDIKGKSLSSGVYFLKLRLNHSENIEKIILWR